MAEIKVYTSPTCPWCHKLKAYLKEKGVKFTDIDVTADDAAAEEMISKSGQMGVPQIEVNGKVIVGFNQAAIDAELKKAKK
jgi:glutaredoxin-like YruB-family protein